MILKTKFQDEDFELGEVVNAKISDLTCYEDDKRFKLTASAKKGGEHTFFYSSIAEFLEMWEDASEEPKEDGIDNIIALVEAYSSIDSERYPKEIVEKLKTFRRLKEADNYCTSCLKKYRKKFIAEQIKERKPK